jgi:uncharacterized protein YjbI with pentapeptide repeats
VIEILHRYTKAVVYRAETATTLREAVRMAVASRADLAGADLAGAYLAGANLTGANLTGANLARADLTRADLAGADLAGADLARAYLAGADLAGANLARAYLTGAKGVNPLRTSPLYLLREQPGPIRLYKLVTAEGVGPFNGGITYAVGQSYAVADADTDETVQCGAGINLATLDWCLKGWREGWRILVAEFTAADIAAIPIGTDGKLRVRRCRIVGEKSLEDVGLAAEIAARKEVVA